MPFCQKCGTPLDNLNLPCPQCGFVREPDSTPQPESLRVTINEGGNSTPTVQETTGNQSATPTQVGTTSFMTAGALTAESTPIPTAATPSIPNASASPATTSTVASNLSPSSQAPAPTDAAIPPATIPVNFQPVTQMAGIPNEQPAAPKKKSKVPIIALAVVGVLIACCATAFGVLFATGVLSFEQPSNNVEVTSDQNAQESEKSTSKQSDGKEGAAAIVGFWDCEYAMVNGKVGRPPSEFSSSFNVFSDGTFKYELQGSKYEGTWMFTSIEDGNPFYIGTLKSGATFAFSAVHLDSIGDVIVLQFTGIDMPLVYTK